MSMTSAAAAHTPRSQLAPLFPGAVATSVLDLRYESGTLHGEEKKFVARACSKRRREFAGGRSCCRQAFDKLGLAQLAVGRREDGVPVWPGGLAGSISHTDIYCGAAVARQADYRYLGLDIEKVEFLERDCWPLVFRTDELQRCAALSARFASRYAALIFSAKECFFKSQYPVTGKLLEFHDLSIVPEPATGTFRIHSYVHLPLEPESVKNLRGRFLFSGGHVFTGLAFSDE